MPEVIVTFPNGDVVRKILGVGAMVLGRDPMCEIPLEDPSTSRRHARISLENGRYSIEDLESKNGTLVNDVAVKRALLNPGDMVTLGAVRVLFQGSRSEWGPDSSVAITDNPPSERSTHFSSPRDNLQLPRERLQMLYDLSARLTQLRHRDELLNDALDICFQTLRFERGAIGVRKPGRRDLQWPVVRNLYRRGGELSLSRSILVKALETGERAIINDAGEELDPTTSIVQQGIRSAMCVPLTDHEQTLGVIYGDRVSGGTKYTEGDVDFLAALARLVTIGLINAQLLEEEEKRVRLENEIGLARRIQQGLFPKELPASGNIQFAVLNEPGSLVSGDYYDVLPLPDGRVGFLIADVTGEGFAAAMLMANLQAAVRVTLPADENPTALMCRWNTLISENTNGSRFITVVLGIVDPSSRKLTLACAGHPPPLLLRTGRSGAPETLTVEPGFPLGVMPKAEYIPSEFDLGDREGAVTIFCYTDGATEAMNVDRQLYGKQRMMEVLVAHAASEPTEIIQRLRESIRQFCGTAEQSDDITLLAVRLE